MATTKITDLFNDRIFEIPRYQRGYAWEKQHVRDLFEDITEAIESNSTHYIGTVVLSKCAEDSKKFYVVDGQQRLTTITLIIAQLLRKVEDEETRLYQKLHYLKKNGKYSLTPLTRDAEFFKVLIDGDITTLEPQNKSQRFLKDAVEEMRNLIDQLPDPVKFLDAVGELEIMEFIENSEGDAIRIFQTVNDRGKPLSIMEKMKSLLIYFSNKYLNKKYDDEINSVFSDIFELYDSIKYNGDKIGITLIKRQNFNEDNILSYHYVTYFSDNYEPTADYVLKNIKQILTNIRKEGDYSERMSSFINKYILSLKSFFTNLNEIVLNVEKDTKYYKLFVLLNLSATLYPLIVKLQEKSLLSTELEGDKYKGVTFFDLVELIDVRVYKTRGTDPKADIVKFVSSIEGKSILDIQNWLLWFNTRWMSREQFNSSLSVNFYPNAALSYIFVNYCEKLNDRSYSITELKDIVNTNPTIEHVLAQTPDFNPETLGFQDMEDFCSYEHRLGNLSLLEKSLNSGVQKKVPLLKVEIGYDKSCFPMTKKLASEIVLKKTFSKDELNLRTEELRNYCVNRWWADTPEGSPEDVFSADGE